MTPRYPIGVLGALLLALTAFGCAEDRPVIDRVQPNALEKSTFTGEWYYVRTVVDVPAANGFTHVGDTDHGGMRKIRWDIQENWLYARRTTELIEGADLKAEEGEDYEGEVVAAYRILSHFDIQNAYNPTTGEQLNIREENTRDRPWYERDYIRVDWSENKVHNYAMSFEAASVEPVPYYVQEIDPDTGERHPDAPHFATDGSYFDITNKLFAKAGTFDYPGYGTIPVCWLFGNEFDECGAGEFTIRNSFKKIDPDHQYEPLPYKGKSTEVFGYFTTDRMVYDPQTGIRQQTKKRFLNRHNIWKQWWDADGEPIPYAERELRPVVYHVNRDFPADLKPIARDMADQWNRVFTDAVEALGHRPEGRALILCENNPVKAGDPAECGLPGSSPRLGDIRYSFMAYVPKYMTYGLLGLGPSNNDPETGEIISGMGYVYHHNNLAAYQVQEMLELLNGDRDPTEYIDGVDLSGWRDAVQDDPSALSTTFGLDDAGYMVEQMTTGAAAQFWAGQRYQITPADEAFMEENGVDAFLEPHFEHMHRLGLMSGARNSSAGRLAQLRDTYIEDLLIDNELLAATGHDPHMPLTDEVLDQVSVARGGLGQLMKQREQIRTDLAARYNKYLPEMADDALMGLARDLKGKSPEEVYEAARTAIYTAVLAHEVGHSLGLMHNFGGSDDTINYHDEYWHIRDDGHVGPRAEGHDPITEAEIDAKLYNHAYSSVMDYAGRYTIDGQGIGKYDRAAILFGYAGKIEVFDNHGEMPVSDFREWFERDGEIIRFANSGPTAVHYTTFYNQMGELMYADSNRRLVDVEAFSPDFSTATVDGEEKVRVPYIYCSHSRANLSDSCLTRDFGADPGERMKNIIDDLNTWYIQRSFPRGSVSNTHMNYVSRWYGRIYNRMKKWHDLYGLYAALLPQFYSPEQMQRFYTDPVDGWGMKTWGVQNAFNYLIQTVLMPDVGNYGLNRYTPDGIPQMAKVGSLGQPNVDVTMGRYFSTDWSFQSGDRECGYFWHECLHHVGFYLDKIMAIEALSDSETNFVARSSPEDLREWEVSFYSTFPDQIAKISAALTNGDFRQVAPHLEDGELVWPNYAGPLTESHDRPMDPYATFTVQLYWQVLGQARFFENYDQSFRDESRIFVLGTGAAPNLDDDRMVTFTDPSTGMVYAALRYDDRMGAGQGVIERAKRLYRNSDLCDADGLSTSVDDDCTPEFPEPLRATARAWLYDHLELLKIMADLSPMMNFGDPYSP